MAPAYRYDEGYQGYQNLRLTIILKGMVLALVIMVVTNLLSGNECPQMEAQELEKSCLSGWTEQKCELKDKSPNAKECQKLEECMRDPAEYLLKLEAQ